MQVNLSYKADEEFEATNAAGNVLPIDMLAQDQKQAMSPTELLLSATAACAAVDIVSMIKKKRKTFVDLKAETTGERREEHPRKFTKIHIKYIIFSPDLAEKEADKVISLAVNNYCSVASSLDPEIELTHGFEIVR